MKVIIPAYQPDHRLLVLIKKIKANSDYEIIIVNDGSAKQFDTIFGLAKDYGCIVLTHEVNQGKGAALKTAFRHVLNSKDSDGLICADCDGQHTWQDIQKLAEAIPKNPSSILLGCRNFIGDVPLKSMLGNKITRAIFRVITGNKIADTQTGLRGFSSTALPWLVSLKGNRYEYEMHQLLEAKNAGFGFYCIPIDTIYEYNNVGSHFHPVRDSIRVFLPILKFCMSSITCGIIDFILLFLLERLTGNLLFSVVTSRIISSLCNYLLNKNLVFKQDKLTSQLTYQELKEEQPSALVLKYYSLVVGILLCNYLLLSLLSSTFGLSLLISKLFTECILFFASYFIQRKFIFQNYKSNINTIPPFHGFH